MPNTAVKPYLHVVAGVIRNPKNAQSIFITQRLKGTHLENLWEFPGGKVEKKESRFHALRRELHEEVGIVIKSALPMQTVFHQYKEKNIQLDVWEVLEYEGEPHGKEGQSAKWIKVDELAEHDFPEADQSVLKAITLPPELLITPEFPEHDLETNIQHFSRLMRKHPYKLVLFRGHHLTDDVYAALAVQLEIICKQHAAQLIITRPTLKSLQGKLFSQFKRVHINSYILQSLSSNPFDESISLSASCHDDAELTMALRLKVEFSVLSTVRETLSHPGRQAKGWYRFRHIAEQAGLPVYALGGVVRKDYRLSRYQGAIGVAGISDFWTV